MFRSLRREVAGHAEVFGLSDHPVCGAKVWLRRNFLDAAATPPHEEGNVNWGQGGCPLVPIVPMSDISGIFRTLLAPEFRLLSGCRIQAAVERARPAGV